LILSLPTGLKRRVPACAKKKHVQLALLNAPGKTVLGFLPDRAMNSISDMKKFGMAALDTSSAASKKWGNLMSVYGHLKKMVVHVHLSNINKHKEYALPNEGVLPLESFLKKLKTNNYKGAVSIRVRPTELHAGDDEKVIAQLKKVKKFVDEFYK
jgi:sugar phosphate isomerase/epimerase